MGGVWCYQLFFFFCISCFICSSCYKVTFRGQFTLLIWNILSLQYWPSDGVTCSHFLFFSFLFVIAPSFWGIFSLFLWLHPVFNFKCQLQNWKGDSTFFVTVLLCYFLFSLFYLSRYILAQRYCFNFLVYNKKHVFSMLFVCNTLGQRTYKGSSLLRCKVVRWLWSHQITIQ